MREGRRIMEQFMALYEDHKFDEANKVIKAVDVENTDTTTLITYLITSMWAKSKLPYRDEFFARVKEKFYRDYDEKEAFSLLKGLE